MGRALLLAILVLAPLVGPAVAAPGTDGPVGAAQVGTDRPAAVEMLGLDGQTRSAVAGHGLDVAAALAIEESTAATALGRQAVRVRFERANGEQARRELLFQAATDVEIAIAELKVARRTVRAKYVNGSVGADQYLRRQVITGRRAAQLRTELEVIGTLADRVPGLSMRSRLETLRVAVTGADGPVTARIGDAIVGAAPPATVYVSVSAEGRVLAMIAGDRYVRVAYRDDLWTPDATAGIGFDEAVTRTSELYPVAFNSSRNLARGMVEHGAGIYEVSMEVREGTIVTYLDADTQSVFHEIQRFSLASVPLGEPVSAVDNGTKLAVNRTYDGGPLRADVVDNGTETALDVPVFIGDTPYRTGSDGAVWGLAPGGPARVTAVGEAGNVSVTVEPHQPTLVDVG